MTCFGWNDELNRFCIILVVNKKCSEASLWLQKIHFSLTVLGLGFLCIWLLCPTSSSLLDPKVGFGSSSQVSPLQDVLLSCLAGSAAHLWIVVYFHRYGTNFLLTTWPCGLVRAGTPWEGSLDAKCFAKHHAGPTSSNPQNNQEADVVSPTLQTWKLRFKEL